VLTLLPPWLASFVFVLKNVPEAKENEKKEPKKNFCTFYLTHIDKDFWQSSHDLQVCTNSSARWTFCADVSENAMTSWHSLALFPGIYIPMIKSSGQHRELMGLRTGVGQGKKWNSGLGGKKSAKFGKKHLADGFFQTLSGNLIENYAYLRRFSWGVWDVWVIKVLSHR